MAAHTPTPWFVGHFQDGVDEIQARCSGDTPERLAIMERFVSKPNDQKANAVFIVTACNAYDELLKALKDLLADIEWNKSTIEPGTFGEKLIREAQSAIAKAEGRPTGIADRRAEINYRITEDKLTDAIFNNSPLDAEGSGTKAEARAQAREMLK